MLVGVDAVRQGATAPPELPASWNPKSQTDAAARARTFALEASLVWTAESLIGYISSLTKAQPALLSNEMTTDLNNERNREYKLVLLRSLLGLAQNPPLAVARAALVWRNRITHVHASNTLSAEVQRQLEQYKDDIADRFQGLDPLAMIDRIHSNRPPRLKEAAAINRAIATVTREIDEAVCANVEVASYLEAIVRHYLAPAETRVRRAHGLWGGTRKHNRRSLINLAAQYGLRTDSSHGIESDLILLTPRTAIAQFGYP